MKKGWLLGYHRRNVAKKAVAVAQKKKQYLVHGECCPQWKWDNNLDGVYLQNQKHEIKNAFSR